MVVKVVVIVVVAWVVVVAAVWLFQRRLIYIPLTSSVAPANRVLAGAEEVVLTTEDGLNLGAWIVPPAGEPNGVTVVVFNGNAGDRSFRAPLASALAQLGFTTLLFDYRGYGGNPGSPSETGLAADARAAIAYLEGRDDIDTQRIVYFGESLGTGVAVGLAVERPPAALILRSPFTSLPDAGSRHYRFLPVRLLMWDRYPSVERITAVGCPVLIVAGERDRIIPYELSSALYDAALEPKRFVLIPGVGHNDFELLAGDQLLAAIMLFLHDMEIVEAETEPDSGLEA